ncbi:MAG: hypothetical protein AAF480_07630 [Actinomycetota bacterium]
MSAELGAVVDLDRYPIDRLDSEAAAELLRLCREELAASGACILPGFLRSTAVEAAVAEVRGLPTFRRSARQSAYGDPPPAELPADHVHRRLWDQTIDVVAGDQFAPTGPLPTLREHPAMTRFLAQALGRPVVHPFADRFQGLNAVVLSPGHEHAWHYDLSDYVVTILLQPAEAGGAFEFAPFIRGARIEGVVGGRDGRVWDERYDDVARLFDGAWPDTRTAGLAAGDLMLFNGERSMHRVRRVEGETARIVAVLSYDDEAGSASTPEINAVLYGDRVLA